MDLTATNTAELSGLSVRSTDTIYQQIRVLMAQACAAQSSFEGKLETDESYFGPKRFRVKRGRRAGSKTILFGLLKSGNCVYTAIVANASKATLQAIIRGKVEPNSVNPTNGWRGYDSLMDIGVERHFMLNHGNNEFGRYSKNVNGIEFLCSYSKHRLDQFRDVSHHTCAKHLKETDFRFNNLHDNLYLALINLLRTRPQLLPLLPKPQR